MRKNLGPKFIILTKLQKRTEDENRYQEGKKSRRGDEICKTNKEDTRRSRRNIKKSTERDEITSIQGKKRS